VYWRPEDSLGSNAQERRTGVVVAGPGSSLTIPGIIVSEIVRAIAKTSRVTRIEVDVAADFMAGLHRASSLAAAHEVNAGADINRHRAPNIPRLRARAFRDLIGPDVGTAIAYAWPGIDNSWIRQFLQIAKASGASTTVVCASLPASNPVKPVALADILYQADRVYVGDVADAAELTQVFGSRGPEVEARKALSLRGRSGRTTDRQITAFLPKNNGGSLATVLSAFDAIPEAWISDYQLHVVMRYTGDVMPDMVAGSYHSDNVRLIGDDISAAELEELCMTSSALSVADPAIDSRAFSSAVDSGIATVVLTDSTVPTVGRGYVGGLLADLRSPSSVHVAFNHALRLEGLQFPSPDAWDRLARRLVPVTSDHSSLEVREPVTHDQ
jgi:hypothetical protein